LKGSSSQAHMQQGPPSLEYLPSFDSFHLAARISLEQWHRHYQVGGIIVSFIAVAA